MPDYVMIIMGEIRQYDARAAAQVSGSRSYTLTRVGKMESLGWLRRSVMEGRGVTD